MTISDFTQELMTARESGSEALQLLAERHLPLVGMMVRRYPSQYTSREELYQQGAVGLMKALKRFDPNRGTSFSTYATKLILAEMRMLQRINQPIHIPRTEQELRERIRRHTETLSSLLNREPTVTELADALHMDAAELMLHLDDPSVSSTDAVSPGGTAMVELIPDPEDWQQRIELRDILMQLPAKDRQLLLLRHRFGLTQKETGERLGMTQMQISRREGIIRTLLKRALTE